MSPTEIPFDFLFWMIITIMSTMLTTAIIQIIKVMQKLQRHRKLMLFFTICLNEQHKTYWNVDFWCFQQLVGLLSLSGVNSFFFFGPRTSWVSRRITLFAQRLKKLAVTLNLMGRLGNRKQDFFFFCTPNE